MGDHVPGKTNGVSKYTESEPDLAVVKQTMTEENKHSGDTRAFSDVPPGLLSREATRGRAP